MAIEIKVLTQKNRTGHNIERILKRYLKIVPDEHLVGLECITVIDRIADKKNKEVGGLYRERYRLQSATIEIALDTVYKGMPKFLYYVPFISKFILAGVLYHEIGHHYQKRLSHGIRKSEQESFAREYEIKMLKRAFWWWLILLLPFKPLVMFLRKRVKTSQERTKRDIR